MYHLVVRTRGHEELFVDVRQSAVKDKGNFKRHRDWMEGVHSWCRESATDNFFKFENVRKETKIACYKQFLSQIKLENKYTRQNFTIYLDKRVKSWLHKYV